MFNKAHAITKLVASCVRVAEAAGNVIKKVTASADLKIVDKGTGGQADIQTEADRSAQYCIEKSLQTKFNNKLTIIGEEQNTTAVDDLELGICPDVLEYDSKVCEEFQKANIEDVVIWVDPLDGTSEFAKAVKTMSKDLEQVTVLIGIAYQERSIAGVIHQPFYPGHENGRTIWAIAGIGTFGLQVMKPTENKVVVTTKSHLTPQVTRALDSLKNAKLVQDVEQVGGAGFKVLRCLEGATAYVFASDGCKKWDTCAPEAVLKSAHGRLTDITGRDILYGEHVQHRNTGGVLATAPRLDHEAFVDAIPEDIKIQLPEKLISHI
ncbi:unnamed protein product [Bursaphelenchus xylophilus]|uniref:3'(2'),5'-bisphosphate nucleotidase 1 n=1 Tax=Bursaphelenchus xylophilus TaxID=6326 RepID=A0A1I7SS86_BURXY|nr:unnamed protein product [Bursaphelenchus xylophilus]CAG9097920.1 unnamed protein product [Bursaphelenchus xylophilus]